MKVLDLGCGPEKERWIPGAIGMDLNDVGDHPNAVIADAQDEWPFPNESFDMIIARYSLSYMYIDRDDLKHLLSEIYRTLKQYGKAIIVDYRHVYDEEQGDYIDVDYLIIQLQLQNALYYVPHLEVESETSRDEFGGTEYVWILNKVW